MLYVYTLQFSDLLHFAVLMCTGLSFYLKPKGNNGVRAASVKKITRLKSFSGKKRKSGENSGKGGIIVLLYQVK